MTDDCKDFEMATSVLLPAEQEVPPASLALECHSSFRHGLSGAMPHKRLERPAHGRTWRYARLAGITAARAPSDARVGDVSG